jgi:SWI/SNF-related matrix-associated actin-dependent regulator 1 of chromatin subfamily A
MPELRPYQKAAVKECLKFVRGRNRFCYNAMQQRLGKTPVSIVIADELKAKYVLVVCPKSVTFQWRKEFETWSGQPRKLVVCTFASVRNVNKLLRKLKRSWPEIDLLIVDEAQNVKSLTAAVTRIVFRRIIPRAKYTLFLSGTPVTNSVVDLWPVVARYVPNEELLNLDIATKQSFGDYFSVAFYGPYGWSYKDVRNGQQLSKLIRKYFFFRQTRKEVAPELPKKQFSIIKLGPEYQISYTPAEWKRLRYEIGAGRIKSESQESGIKKIPAIVDFVENLLEDGPVILYAYHRLVLEGYVKKLSKYKPVVVHGQTKEKERFDAFTAFQNGQSQLFIGQIKAAGTGVKLSRGKVIVLAEFTYSAADLAQVTDRAVDMEDTEAVTAFLFIAEGSPDDNMIGNVVDKAKVMSEVVEGAA